MAVTRGTPRAGSGDNAMALTLEIISRQRGDLGEKSRVRFDGRGGNIGRSIECDWVLPDPDRFVSSRHAAIDFRSGSYYLIDTSTNGVFVNDADTPVGKGNPQRLFNGDRVRMGEFLMVVRIDDADDIDFDAALEHEDPVSRRHRVEAPETAANTMVDEHLITGAIDVLSLEPSLIEDPKAAFRPGTTQPVDRGRKPDAKDAAGTGARNSDAGAGKAPDDSPAAQRARLSVVQGGAAQAAGNGNASRDARHAGAAPAPRARGAEPAGNDADRAIAVFLRAAGLDADTLPAMPLETLLHRLGQLTRETVVGLSETLHSRAQQKSDMRLSNTTIQPRQNNPLKFSASVDEALARLLGDESSEYLPAVEAVREAFGDIKRHQAATLVASRRAFEDFFERLDPTELEERFERGGKRKSLLPGGSRARYWELYGELYQALTQHAPGQFPQIYTEEFARAYDEALAELQQRRERA